MCCYYSCDTLGATDPSNNVICLIMTEGIKEIIGYICNIWTFPHQSNQVSVYLKVEQNTAIFANNCHIFFDILLHFVPTPGPVYE